MEVLRYEDFLNGLNEAKKAKKEESLTDPKKPSDSKKEETPKNDTPEAPIVSDKKIKVTLDVDLVGAKSSRFVELFPKASRSGDDVEPNRAVMRVEEEKLIDTLKILKKECKVKEILVKL